MVPKMGFNDANQAILKPKAQIALMKKAKDGFAEDIKANDEDTEMEESRQENRGDVAGSGNETSAAGGDERQQ